MGGSTCAAVGFVNVRAEQASSAQRGPEFSRTIWLASQAS